MAAKEERYINQYEKYEMLLNRVGYSTKISHRELVEMTEHRKELEKMTKPVLDTLRSYQDLPSDKALAALAIEDKMPLRQAMSDRCKIKLCICQENVLLAMKAKYERNTDRRH